MRKQASIVFGMVLSVVLLVALFLKINWDDFIAELRNVQLLYVPLLMFLTLATFWIRAVRWRLLLPLENAPGTGQLFKATTVGFMATYILPLRAGEVVRPWFLSRISRISFSTGFASIVTERVFDSLTLLALLAICLPRLTAPPPWILAGAKAVGILTLAILFIMVASYFQGERFLAWGCGCVHLLFGRRAPRLAARIDSMIGEFLGGLRAVSSGRQLAVIFAWSFVLWLTSALWFQVGLWTFGQYPSFELGMLLAVVVSFAVAAPAAPGFIGTYQAGCVVALSLLSKFPREFALAYSILSHTIQILVIVAAGLWILQREQFGMADLRRHSGR